MKHKLHTMYLRRIIKLRKYFEFNRHEYYALVVVDSNHDEIQEAARVYVEEAAGEGIDEVLEEGMPDEVSKKHAFWVLANSKGAESRLVAQVLELINIAKNTCIVVDRSLG